MEGTVRTREFDKRLEEILEHETPQTADDIHIVYTPESYWIAVQSVLQEMAAAEARAKEASVDLANK